MEDDLISSTDFDFEAGRLMDLSSQQAWKMDTSLNITFYKHAELNTYESKQQNRKVFDEFVYVRILSPANRLNVIERRATDEDRQRFARHFRAFIERGEQLLTGTPLTELPGMSPGRVLEFNALKIETVEQLAGMPDTTAQLLGTGGVSLKQQAQLFLDERGNNKHLSQENREMRARIDELEKLIKSRLTASADGPSIAVGPTIAVAK